MRTIQSMQKMNMFFIESEFLYSVPYRAVFTAL